MTNIQASIEHTQSVLEDRVVGIPADVAIGAALRMIAKLAEGMSASERVYIGLIMATYTGKVASSVAVARQSF
jgi:hypothetical protein